MADRLHASLQKKDSYTRHLLALSVVEVNPNHSSLNPVPRAQPDIFHPEPIFNLIPPHCSLFTVHCSLILPPPFDLGPSTFDEGVEWAVPSTLLNLM